jgi:predicted nuclease of predicted toxin-antitoxin system
VRNLGLREARDRDIFYAARDAEAIVLTKDRDLVDLVMQHGSPPQILWITCGNTSNARLKSILSQAWPTVEVLLAAGEKVIEVSDTVTQRFIEEDLEGLPQ